MNSKRTVFWKQHFCKVPLICGEGEIFCLLNSLQSHLSVYYPHSKVAKETFTVCTTYLLFAGNALALESRCLFTSRGWILCQNYLLWLHHLQVKSMEQKISTTEGASPFSHQIGLGRRSDIVYRILVNSPDGVLCGKPARSRGNVWDRPMKHPHNPAPVNTSSPLQRKAHCEWADLSGFIANPSTWTCKGVWPHPDSWVSSFCFHLLVIRIDFRGSKISSVHQRAIIACLGNAAVLHVLLVCVCSLIGKV